MLSIIKSYGLYGIDGYEVRVEVDVNTGLPSIEMVGLPDTAIKESKERVRSAIKNSGFLFTPNKVTVNFAPADLKKEGSIYDLPVALGILTATSQASTQNLNDTIFVGELSLDGRLRHIKGLMPMLISAKTKGYKNIVIPFDNALEARYLDGLNVYAIKNLRDAVQYLNNPEVIEPLQLQPLDNIESEIENYTHDIKYVKGQSFARRALEVAAAGGHNILLIGPPGGGKTMLAKCLPTILPNLTVDEALETTKIHSVAGTLDSRIGIITNRPFRSPHHTASRIALTGGGTNSKPGEISLAHNGVLFLDELLEYPRATLEILRQPLEDNYITISRAMRTITYPANFMLVASMNPCPCGNYGSKTRECTCSPAQISKYMSKLSGPLLDRIDIHVEIENVTYEDISTKSEEEDSKTIRQRVNKARKIQQQRFKDANINANCSMDSMQLKEYCKLDTKTEFLIKNAFEKLGLSVRAYTRILKVARTIADLDDKQDIDIKHISEALGYRSLDRSYWK